MAFSFSRPVKQQVTIVNQTFTDAKMAGAQWDFQAGVGECDDGKFTTNSESTTNTTQLKLSKFNTAGSDSSFMKFIAVQSILQFTDANSKSAAFTILSSAVDDNGCLVLGVNFESGVTPWEGRYVITPLPGA